MTELKVEDAEIRSAAFAHVRRLQSLNDHINSDHLRAGFTFQGVRLPLINPQRGIFKPRQMRYLLSIRTVYPRSGAKVWYDDQRRVHDVDGPGGRAQVCARRLRWDAAALHAGSTKYGRTAGKC